MYSRQCHFFFFLFIPEELSLNEDHRARPKKAAFY